MPILVSKFGGSSTASADRLRQVLAIVRASPARRCVVLSAPGADEARREKMTALLASCWRLRRDRRACAAAVQRAARRFGEIADALGVAGFEDRAAAQIKGALAVSQAMTLSRGEYLCGRLFSEFSGIHFEDAAGIVAFDSAGDLNAEATLARFIGLSRRHARAIVPGFYGADPSGRVRVFPRNGSDITGALAAAGMGAGLYENWTDVPGLMTADPAIVPRARLIPQVSYSQMRALARAGAQVLHPACLDPVAMAGIPTRLRCTMDPDSFGTLIDDKVDRVAPCVVGKREAALPSRACEGDAPLTACISVFGVARQSVLEAARLLKPVYVEPALDCIRLYVERPAYEMSLRALHARLIEA